MIVAAACLSGCLVGPDYKAPKSSAPTTWSSPSKPSTTRPTTFPSTAPTTQVSSTSTAPADVAMWWTSFGDPTLDSLITRAIATNLDLRQAQSRLRQARAAYGITNAGLYPQLDVSGQFSRSRSGSSTGGFATGTDGTTIVVPSSSTRNLFQVGLDAAWEVDVFGGLRRDVEASTADIQAAVEDLRDTQVTLTAEVAMDYLNLRGFQRQIVIAQSNLESQRHSAELTRKQFRGGLVSGLDVANAEAQVASTAAGIPLLESNVRQAIYSLSLLLAKQPAELVDELSKQAPIPTTPPEIPIGLPSDLLRRRPDVRRAEAQLHAATARIGVATSDLFPKFNLTGSFGLDGNKVQSLTDWRNRFWSFGPTVSWPIFDAGRIRANIDVQNALQEQALLTYQSAVLSSLRDVETALVAYVKEQEHRRALGDAAAANRRAVSLATQLYTQGQTDFLNVLTAQRSLYDSEDAMVQSDRTVATNLVALYKALGGGWEIVAPTTAPTTAPRSMGS